MNSRILLFLLLGCCTRDATGGYVRTGGTFTTPIPPSTPVDASSRAPAENLVRVIPGGLTRITDRDLGVVCYYKQAEAHGGVQGNLEYLSYGYGYGYAALSCLPIPPR